MKDLKVRDLMTEVVLSVHPDDTVEKVYDLMNERGIRHLTVVDADGDLVGLVSHRDLPVLESSKLVGIITESDFVRYFCAAPRPATRASASGWFS
jgi:CBS domain-containing protein